jgi:tRNA (guanosine-2'-O-)-methyltransferase
MNISEYSQNHFFENSPLEFCDDKWGDYNKRKLSFTEIIEKLSPLVTEERLMTINTVIDKRSKGFIPILENIYDRGNASAAMRSAEAFGFFEMNRVEKKDQYFKSANRVTQGADKWLNIKTFETST